MWQESLPDSAVDSSSFPSSVALVEPEGNTPSFFLKDGRKIRVGDCALFKSPWDSPPFIGIIKKLTGDRDRLSLGVNWLYRPSDVKLVKGVSLEAAPNEVFYSFHKDEIPAGSLLHPCKVAFLSKGAELPSGISSFVCRRVYDTENRCLWWLTDKDYVKERQEEVDKLLNWTRVEMHGALHSGGRSPKPLNGPSSNSQIKTSADSVQNSGSLSSQVKGKKRERLDQVSDSSKRERLQKAEDGDSGQSRAADMLKSEIAKITDKGGLVHFDGVEKLVQLMKADSGDRKIDLAGRIMLINVISATDRSDCLGGFVQLRGLPVFDDWLQEVHKGKVGDGSNLKESDKSVEDYLFALLRALDKLPVNLHALQSCNIGKSVNHLRTHKNTEIQKRARSLVDTWKKRVEAEMNMIDTESGSNRGVSWPTKTVPTQGSQVGIKKSGVSNDPSSRNSVVQSSATKGLQVKMGTAEGFGKLSASSASIKSSTVPVVSNSKDMTFRTSAGPGNPELLLTPIKEEQSSSSSQSQNNCQSCSSDHAKTVGSCKEDARSSTTISVSKSSGATLRYEKTSNGISQMAVSGAQKELGSINVVSPGRNSLEKSSPTGIPQEKSPDVPIVDNGPNQRLIVRLPNTGRSPCRGASGSCYEDPAQGNSKASPASKHENGGRRLRSRKEAPLHTDGGMNKETGQGKDGLFVSDETVVFTCNEKPKDVEVNEEATETLKGAGSLLAGMHPSEKSYDASLSSMAALVESCVKISEATASASPDDDVGMNLLASVAAGEILRSGSTSSTASPQRLSALAEESCTMYCQTDGVTGGGGNGSPKNDQKVTTVCCNEMEECGSVLNVSPTKLQNSAELSFMRPEVRPVEGTSESSAKASGLKDERHMEVEGTNCSHENGQTLDSSTKARSSMLVDDKKIEDASERVEESSIAAASSEPLSQDTDMSKEMKETKSQSFDVFVPKQHNTDKEVQTCVSTDNNPSPSAAVELDCKDEKSGDAGLPSAPIDKVLNKTKAELADDSDGVADTGDDKAKVTLGCSLSDHDSRWSDDKSAIREVSRGSSHMHSSTVPLPENECGHKLEGDEFDSMKEVHATGAEPLVCNAGSGSSVKLDFDLNEGFPVDDVNQGESTKQAALSMSAVHLPSPLPISSMPGIFSTSITVAAAAKGPFVPPENPLRGKGELGWKGSAATSAFRPAEPRRISEMAVNASDVPAADAAVSQQSRPPLDFDLNVADERISEDVSHVSARASCSESRSHDRASVGLDLDLNRVDDDSNAMPFSINKVSRIEGPEVPSWSSSAVGLSTVASTSSRGFDLNSGPGIDEVTDIASSSQPMRSSLAFPSTMTGIRLNGAEFRNFSPWFPPTNSFSAMTVPSMLSGRGEQNYTAAVGSQRILASPSASTSFGLEMCRPPVLPSSPAIPFSSNTTLSYSGFPFETSFPPSSSFSTASTVYGNSTLGGPLCFPTIPSQFVGPSGVITSPYSRPFVMSLPGVAGGVGSDSRKWGGHIDLNSGPGGIDSERRDERSTSAVRHPSSGLLLPDEHLKAYQFPVGVASAGAGAVFKRKEPEGGWELADRFSNKLSSSQ